MPSFTSKVRQLVPNDVFPLYLRLQLNTGKFDKCSMKILSYVNKLLYDFRGCSQSQIDVVPTPRL